MYAEGDMLLNCRKAVVSGTSF